MRVAEARGSRVKHRFMSAYERLLKKVAELRDLQGVLGLLTWDQETYLPKKGEGSRAEQLATLQGLYHERLVDGALGDLVGEAAAQGALPEGGKELLRVLSWERERAVRIPGNLVKELALAQSQGVSAWKAAREARRFEAFAPALERLLELRRRQADLWGAGKERYDALLEGYEQGMTVERLGPVLKRLEGELAGMTRALADARQRTARAKVLEGRRFDLDKQWSLSVKVLSDMGFDFDAGRQDKSVHPFTVGNHPLDVRLTNRFDESTPLPALFGALHEGGHGLYEQGFSPTHYRTCLAQAPSMGLHESQSRLWENLVGRSRAFWAHYFPLVQEFFRPVLDDVAVGDFYAHVNRVQPSLIRVEADEVTYNLHIVLRYELEVALLRGDLEVRGLPAEWNRRMKAGLGLVPPDDVAGVLQDIHWAWGEFGYFPTYAVGNLYSASLFGQALRERPGLVDDLSSGKLLPLREWLRSQVHSQGFLLPAEELVRKLTGQGLAEKDFVEYLKRKYKELYPGAF